MNDMLSGGGEGINKDDVVRFFNALARGGMTRSRWTKTR